ncbi:hypothetical protein CDL15_Pgr012700 [Punica granatum]|uniref:Non-specific phospholipase C3-like n=1 Tax=Punica granatum TaxID=22663 RepID=A0A218XEV8_PUNGR|nr:hypothetical protein CDL15_Pgr012700 [Punica granatum]
MAAESTQSPPSCPIKHIVILVQENRSFDHMLGWMKSLNPEIDGVTGAESNPLPASSAESEDQNSIPRLLHFQDNATYIDPDPDHSFQAIYEQVFGKPWTAEEAAEQKPPTMDGFARNAEAKMEGLAEIVMSGFQPDAVPVFKQLVSEFAVCDRWFASLPAATQPNRLYVHAATSHGATGNDTEQLIKGFPQKTIMESMHEAGHTFGIYYQYPASTFFYRNLRKPKYLKHFHQFDLLFKKHCKEGKLPNYVVIEQRYFEVSGLPANDDHPSHDVSEGQKFIKEVYEALRSSPQWNEILFLIVYDEHGGFYDHVPTPWQGVPNPDDIIGPEPYNFKFDRLGVRVPAILISPWIEPGTVLHEPTGPYPTSQFEHSSIAATVKKIFNLKDFLTKRDEWAVTLAEPVKMRESGPNEEASLNDFQEQLVQMAATLNGDHKKDTYPHKMVENITVSAAVEYIEGAFKMFCDECEKLKDEDGVEEAESSEDNQKDVPTLAATRKTPKSFVQKVFSCIICDN